ncbi:hypothetical protein ACGFYA_28595 [Streptomyces sp. NPDC048305]|uniref:hypothetical protein n=1 Tax=Streptomyces sp. NPDC048305 TaxID=3365532 RepID=UPI003719CEA6
MSHRSSPHSPLGHVLFGPADYRGAPPTSLVVEAMVVACGGVLAVGGAGMASVLLGIALDQAQAVGMTVVGGLVLFLLVARAGRLLIGGVCVLGLLLALSVPRATADSIMAERGQRQEVVVTAVAAGNVHDRYLCSVRRDDGTPVPVRLWRGCGSAVVPGDRIGMVLDPEGRVPPRGVEERGPMWTLVRCLLLAGSASALSFMAVLRSYRLPPVSPSPREAPAAG